MENQQDIYRTEALELLTDLEESLLELEKAPDDSELIGRIFRAMHTIKGSGSMFGYDQIAAFTHDIETTYDLVRTGELKVTNKLIDLTLAAGDQIRIMLDDPELCPEATQDILKQFQTIAPANNSGSSALEYEEINTDNEEMHQQSFWIRFVPEPNMMTMGSNPVLLLNEMNGLGRLYLISHTSNVPLLEAIDPDKCYTYWDMILTTDQGIDAIHDVFIFVEDDCKLTIELIDNEGRIGDQESKELAKLLAKEGKKSPNQIFKRLAKQIEKMEPHQDSLFEAKSITAETPVNNSDSTNEEKVLSPAQAKTTNVSNIRVASEKLDTLVDLVGELVIVQERLNQFSIQKDDSELTLVAEETNRLISELRDVAMEMRLLPIGSTFSKFKRLVRDLANEQGKDIVLTTEGGETELDKTVLERLNDPLVHIIRNSIDHGIEPSSVRMFSGKSNQSNIHLSASHSGSDVLIKIKDDGRGLNTQAIYKKAIERGLINPDTELSKKEIHSMIFQPGFSTANQVSNLSGRGVGMDVVKRNIEELRGSVSIMSEENVGTTITLRLPITLGIIEGLLVRVSQSYFVLPLSAVHECVDLRRKGQINGKSIANVRGEIVPYISLRQQFDIADEIPEIEHILIAKVNESSIGFLVDEVIGEHQIVIKSLGKMYRQVEGLSGATILGDGTVALILDVQKLAELAEMNEIENHQRDVA